VGQAAFCQRCEADLEVTEVSPLMLDWTDDLVSQDLEEELGFEPDLVPA
jgi:hypothetical protein